MSSHHFVTPPEIGPKGGIFVSLWRNFLASFSSGKNYCKEFFQAPKRTRFLVLRHRKGEVFLCCEVPILVRPSKGLSITEFFFCKAKAKKDKHHPLQFPSFPVGRGRVRSWDRTSLKLLNHAALPNIFPPTFLLNLSSILRISLRGPMGNHCASANFWMLTKAPPEICRVPPLNQGRAGGIGRYPPVRSPSPGKLPDSKTRQEGKNVLPLTEMCARDPPSWRPFEPRCTLDPSPALVPGQPFCRR